MTAVNATQTKPSLTPASVSAAAVSTDPSKIGSAADWRGPSKVSDAQFQAGFRMNRVALSHGGCCHFRGWQNEVPNDVAFLIAQGPAYAGQSVQVNSQTFQNAAIVLVKRGNGDPARMGEHTQVDVAGKPGDEVRLHYLRADAQATFTPSADGRGLTIKGKIPMQQGGDAHWRDVFVTLKDAPSSQSVSSDAHFRYHQRDFFGSEGVGYKQAPKAGDADLRNSLGGEHVETLQAYFKAGYHTSMDGKSVYDQGGKVVPDAVVKAAVAREKK